MESILFEIKMWVKGINSQYIHLYTKDASVAAHYAKLMDHEVKVIGEDLIKGIPLKLVAIDDLPQLRHPDGATLTPVI